MILKRTLTFLLICACSLTVLLGQNQFQLPDTVRLSLEQLRMLETMAVDTVNG